MSEAGIKPSLEAIRELTDDQKQGVSSMFGGPSFIDPEKFAQMCFASRLKALKVKLVAVNEERFTDEILAIETQEELSAFISRPDTEVTRNAVLLATSGGDLYRIDEVSASSGGGLTLNWAANGQGFGQMSFYVGEDGKIHVDSECMGRHYIRSVLMRLADELVID